MKTLTGYFIAVAVALAVVLVATHSINNGAKFKSALIFVAGYLIGTMALYIKMRWFL